MIICSRVELRAGARLLLSDFSVTVGEGDRVALVGRNGSGKTTLMAVLAGESAPTAGTVTRTGPVGYLPQDSRAADQDTTVMDRILSARGLDAVVRRLRAAEIAMARAATPSELEQAMRDYTRAEAQFQSGGGYAAEAEAARIAAGLGLGEPVVAGPVGALSGGQRRRVELARILFAGDRDGTLVLDEPTNHLDADSIAWLRAFLLGHRGGMILVSHDTGLLADLALRVLHLDATRAMIDVYNGGWSSYLALRDADERRRRRQRANVERKAATLHAQADRMKARSATSVTARSMARRADRMLDSLEPQRHAEKTARIRLPDPAPCGRTPLAAVGVSKSYGSNRVLEGVDIAVDRGTRLVVLGHNGAGKTTLLRILAGSERPDAGRIVHGHGLRLGYFAQEHDTLDLNATVIANLRDAAPQLADEDARRVLGTFLFRGDDVDKPARVLSGDERTRLALARLIHTGANVLLLDEPTNNHDPASRDEVLAAVASYTGAIVMVTHDLGAIDALHPDHVLLLPGAHEDTWKDAYRDLVTLT